MPARAEDLNPEQRRAVDHDGSPLVVLAGAGAGKTRVITRRVARLLLAGAAPGSVLALTFTNRAAREMRERVEALVGAHPGLFVGTFHAFGLRLLRRHSALASLGRSFAVLDRQDQLRLVQRCLEELRGPAERLGERAALAGLSRARNGLLAATGNAWTDELRSLYERRLVEAGAVDFDDLLVRPLALLADHPEIAERERPGHVLVDEFQDTNRAQLELLERLWPASGDVVVVGDEDQSIYAFRGATPENLLQFTRRHPASQIVRLERNYRSRAPILAAAARLVARNRGRLGKALVPVREGGEPVRVLAAATAEDEARLAIAEVAQMAERFSAAEVAVLYRTNAQSRALEEELLRQHIPHRLIRAQRFYERREVKDVIAYLRLLVDPEDDLAFTRIVNVPARGIGPAVTDALAARASARGGSLLAAARELQSEASGPTRRLSPFVALIDRLQLLVAGSGPADLVRAVLEQTGYRLHLERSADSADEERRGANLDELVRKAEAAGRGPGDDGLGSFLDEVSLHGEADEPGANAVSLMTLHNAKGLEFQAVVIVGLEEGLLPHHGIGEEQGQGSGPRPGDVEEERRLLYVGMTRARDQLVLTHSLRRRLWGDAALTRPSRFLDELVGEHVTRPGGSATPASGPASVADHRAGARWEREPRSPPPRDRPPLPRRPERGPPESASAGQPDTKAERIERGSWVRHPVYGEGLVIASEGSGAGQKVSIRFSSGLLKKFQLQHADLKAVRRVRGGR